MNQKKEREEVRYRDFELSRLDRNADMFASDGSVDMKAEAIYSEHEQKKPTRRLMRELSAQYSGKQYQLSDECAVKEYVFWRAILSGALPEEVRGLSESSSTHNFCLAPDPSIFTHRLLDGNALERFRQEIDSRLEKRSKVALKKETKYLVYVNMDPDSAYRISLDEQGDLHGCMEIGDSLIRMTLKGFTGPRPDFAVYINGLCEQNRQEIKWTEPWVFTVTHDFDHPEFSHLTVLPCHGRQQIILVIWNGIEFRLIESILNKVIPQVQERLAWWYTPVAELDNLVPWQCLQLRMESDLIAYLQKHYNLGDFGCPE